MMAAVLRRVRVAAPSPARARRLSHPSRSRARAPKHSPAPALSSSHPSPCPGPGPGLSDWATGTWEAVQTPAGEWVAECEIGAYGDTLAPGAYTVWVALGSPVGSGWGMDVGIITVD